MVETFEINHHLTPLFGSRIHIKFDTAYSKHYMPGGVTCMSSRRPIDRGRTETRRSSSSLAGHSWGRLTIPTVLPAGSEMEQKLGKKPSKLSVQQC
jgi:hypothetical protein